MKTKLIIMLAVLSTLSSIAQQGINYKALIKDNEGNAIKEQTVTVVFTILQGTTAVYAETHASTTDANGIIILNIGMGTVQSGDFDAIVWANDDHFLNVQIDTGNGLVNMGTTQFMAVPYANHARTVEEHDHLGETWSGSNPLSIFNSGPFNAAALIINNSAGHGLDITANTLGINIGNTGGTSINVQNAGHNGVNVMTAENYGGYFVGNNGGVFAAAPDNSTPDIILGVTSMTEDEGIISSLENAPSSDLWLKSNDAVVIVLDQNDDEDGDFEIKANNSPAVIFNVSEDGKVGISTSTPSTKLQIIGGTDASLADGSGYVVLGSENSVNMVLDQNEIMIRDNGVASNLFLQLDGGDVWVGNNVVHSSDRRLKQDINNLSYGLDEILQLVPKTYYWKNRDQSKKSLGLIAQDVQSIISEIVNTADDDIKTLSISYTELIPVLIKAIQEQQQIIESQNKKITTQINQNSTQNNKINTQASSIELLIKRIERLESSNQ